jgi:hypothetical protein
MSPNTVPFGCTAVFAFVFGIWFLSEGINYSRNKETIDGYCTVNNVVYTKDIHDTQNMVVCDCGRNCKSNEGMCLSVFGKFTSNDEKIKMNGKFAKNVNSKVTTCTYQEENCKEVPRSQALKNIYNQAKPFIQLKNKTQTMDCYYHSGVVYINNEYNINLFIVSCVIFSIFCLCCLVFGVKIICEEKDCCNSVSSV